MRNLISEQQMRALHAAAAAAGANHDDIKLLVTRRFFEASLNDLNAGAAKWLIEHYASLKPAPQRTFSPRIGAFPKTGPFARRPPTRAPQQPAQPQVDGKPIMAPEPTADIADDFTTPPADHNFYQEELAPQDHDTALKIIREARAAASACVPVHSGPYERCRASKYWQRRLYVTAYDQAMLQIMRRGGSAQRPADPPPEPDHIDTSEQPFVPLPDELEALQESIAALDVTSDLVDVEVDAGDVQLARDAASAQSDDDFELEPEPDRPAGFFGISTATFGPDAEQPQAAASHPLPEPESSMSAPPFSLAKSPIRTPIALQPKPAAPAAAMPRPPRPTFLGAPAPKQLDPKPAAAAAQHQTRMRDVDFVDTIPF